MEAVWQVLNAGLPSDATGVRVEPGAIQLLDATLLGNRLTLHFNRDFLRYEPGSVGFEEVFRLIHRAVGRVRDPAFAHTEIYTLIDGVPLHRLLAVLDAVPAGQTQAEPAPSGSPAAAALTARRVALSPGHGYYLNGTRWVLQRDYFWGIVEDFVNHDLISELDTLLRESGAQVFPLRELNRVAGAGESGFPRWQEAARYHVKSLGADASVWNESGFTHLEQDIRCRPRYANAINADVLVSIHNNGGGGTGTETLYDTNNTAAAESRRLADILHASIITTIRREYNAAWPDRRVKGFNGSYGENRLATRPSVLIELAFMDRQTPDNLALQDEVFKRLVARAIRDGLREFFEGPLTVPAGPVGLVATPELDGIELSWTDRADNESGFRIERRLEGGGSWSPLASTPANASRHRDAAPAVGAVYEYRIVAYNAAGDSLLASNEVTAARLPASTVLVLAGEPPPAAPVRDWLQSAAFTFTVVDALGSPVEGAKLSVEDSLRSLTAVSSATSSDASGRITYESEVPLGQADGEYRLTFRTSKRGYTSSSAVTRTIAVVHSGSTSSAPSILRQPAPQSLTAGAEALFSVAAVGAAPLSYQWRRNGINLAGANGSSLTLVDTGPAVAGGYSVVVSNAVGSISSLEVPLRVHPKAWLSNVSVRTSLAASQTVIVGFIVSGGAKDLLLRAAGPSLSTFGLTTAMADPRLVLFRDASQIAANNDWPAALGAVMGSVGAFPFPAASRDAALLHEVGGAHTVHASGSAAGVVLIEGYDALGGNAVRLINLSARNRVGTGADILITGFVVTGSGSQRLLIRAVGPTLAALGVPGVLADPQLEVLEGATSLAQNDNWEGALSNTFAQVGAFPLPNGSRDSAVVVTLAAGRSYTAQVSGVAGGTGEALVEVYELGPP